jgi:hypothetical protein
MKLGTIRLVDNRVVLKEKDMADSFIPLSIGDAFAFATWIEKNRTLLLYVQKHYIPPEVFNPQEPTTQTRKPGFHDSDGTTETNNEKGANYGVL